MLNRVLFFCERTSPHGQSRRGRVVAALIAIVLAAPEGIAAVPLRLGMMGDSMSAGNGSANGEFPNWHTQLSAAGRVTVGLGANQAVDGAMTSDLAVQRAPIVSLVQNGQLDYSMLMIGAIDSVQLGYDLIVSGDPSGLPTSFSNGVLAEIDATLDAIAAAGPVHQIVANIPDVVATPLVQGIIQDTNTSPFLVAQFQNAVEYTNGLIAAHGLARGLPVLDIFRLSRDVAGHPPLTLAGVPIGNLFSPDGFHPAPIMHGLVANLFIAAANDAYGAGLAPLSDQQLVQNAGYVPLLNGPTYFDVSPYVLLPAPPIRPGDFDSDGDVDGADFVAWQTNFPKATGATLAQGDADGDGDVDGADFVVWQTNFPFSPGQAASPVPEPAGILLLSICVVLMAPCRIRNRVG